MSMRRGLTTVAALACLAAAGCGGDDDEDGGSASKTDWVKQANAICRETEQKFASLPEQLGLSPDDPGRQKERELLEEKLERLRDLDPPDAAAGDLDRMISLDEQSYGLTDDFLAAVKDSKKGELGEQASHLDRSVKVLDKQKRLNDDATRIARELGLTAC